jgi:hypothetical protein
MGYLRRVDTQRIWLDEWEWACCGTPFEVGDQVSFQTDPRSEALATMLGPEFAPSVDRQESHHDDGGRGEATGTVVAVWAVAFEYTERRVPREVPPEAAPRAFRLPSSDARPGDGMTVMGSGKPDTIVRELIPGSARVSPLPRVPWPPRESEPMFDGQPAPDGFTGYLVDLELR